MASFLRRAVMLVSNTLKLQPYRKLVGEDLDGNKYFQVLPQRYFLGLLKTSRESRMVVPPNLPAGPLTSSKTISVTKEWDSWLRRRRDDPPTLDELKVNVEKYNVIQERVKALEKKQEFLKTKEHINISSSAEEQTVESWSSKKQ